MNSYSAWRGLELFALMLALTCGAEAAAAPPPDLHQEMRQDAPAPAERPVRTSPAPPRGALTRSGFFSVQVNTDADGNNIVGDAANEPSIVVSPVDPNLMAIGFRQFDTIHSNFRQAGYAYSRDGGRTWTFPGKIEPGVWRTDPVLDCDVAGRFYYFSLADAYCCDLFISEDGGMTWNVKTATSGGDKAWMAVDRTSEIGQGNLYCTWTDRYTCRNLGRAADFLRSIDSGATFDPAIKLEGHPFWGTVAIGPRGQVYIGDASAMMLKSRNARDDEAEPRFRLVGAAALGGYPTGWRGPNPAGLLGQVWTVANRLPGPRKGHVYVLASVERVGVDRLDVMFIRSEDGGRTFSPPVRVNDDAPGNAWQWFGTLALAPSGRLDALWNDTRALQSDHWSEVTYAYSTDEGRTWSENIPVSPLWDSWIGWPNQNKIGDYTTMISDDAGAHVAYAATFNGEQDVYYLRIAPDCNGNGLHDGDDIALGRSRDDNANGLPDECE